MLYGIVFRLSSSYLVSACRRIIFFGHYFVIDHITYHIGIMREKFDGGVGLAICGGV